jgi:hypothetical protein
MEDRSKKNIYTKRSMIIYTKSNVNVYVIVELLYGTWGRRERKRE